MVDFDDFGGGFGDEADDFESSTSKTSSDVRTSDLDAPSSDLELFAKEVMEALMADNLPPTPYNYSVYFDKLLEDKSESLRKEINSILEFEDSSDTEKSLQLEHNVKQGFNSIKNILHVSATLYKNSVLMKKLLQKRKQEITQNGGDQAMNVMYNLENDVDKLSKIFKKQIDVMKTNYDETKAVVETVENESIFDNQYGMYNKRYLLSKLEQEVQQIAEFKHNSSLVVVKLSRNLVDSIKQAKVVNLMTKNVSRLLMKSSRRSDIVAHYGDGTFAMLLRHTDMFSAQKASERVIDMVSNANFFLGDHEYQLAVSIGIANILSTQSSEVILDKALDAMDASDKDSTKDYTVAVD